jgi:hypothetical protein
LGFIGLISNGSGEGVTSWIFASSKKIFDEPNKVDIVSASLSNGPGDGVTSSAKIIDMSLGGSLDESLSRGSLSGALGESLGRGSLGATLSNGFRYGVAI